MKALTSGARARREKTKHEKARVNLGPSHVKLDSKSFEEAVGSETLPSGWTRLAMGDLGRWIGGGTPSKANPRFWTDGKIPWVSPKDMKVAFIDDAEDHITEDAVAQSATNVIEAGSVLIVVRSGILQHTLPVAVTRRQVALNQDLKGLTPRENVDAVYLALALKAFERDILHTCTKTGTTVQSLELPVFLRFQIPVAPLAEQRRIVEEIEKQFTRLDAGVAALRRVQANLKRYRAAVLKAACEGRLVPTEADLNASERGTPAFENGEELLTRILTERRQNWRGRGSYKEAAPPDADELPLLASGWTWASLGQLAHSSSYGTSAKCRPDNAGPAVLRIPNIAGGQLDLTDLKFAGTDETIPAGDELAPCDLLIIRTNGSKGLIGRSAIIKRRFDRPTGYASYLIRFRLFDSPALCDWIGMVWNAPFLREWIERRAATSAGQHNISMRVLGTMPIPLPPLAEQERVVAEVARRLSVVDELEAMVSINLQRANRLRQSILQKAFTGTLV